MMGVEPLDEDLNVNIALRSGMTTGDDKGKQPKDNGWVRKARENEIGFDLEPTKETFVEAKKSFVEASTLGIQDKLSAEVDPSMLTTFLEICMKLLRNRKVVKGL